MFSFLKSPTACLIAIFAVPAVLFAHDPGFSSASITIGDKQIEAIVTFSSVEMEALLARSEKSSLHSLSGEVFLVGGISAAASEVSTDSDNNSLFRFSYPRTANSDLALRSPLISTLNPGHRQYLLVRDASHELLLQKLLKADDDTVTLELSPVSPKASPSRNRTISGPILLVIVFAGTILIVIALLWLTMRFAHRVWALPAIVLLCTSPLGQVIATSSRDVRISLFRSGLELPSAIDSEKRANRGGIVNSRFPIDFA